MSVHAMICELNPLHNGHLAVLGRMREDAPEATVLLIMSGNFTQRAGAAMFDKYARARAAVECGADIVVELPFPFSSSGAEHFGRAGVKLAEALGATSLYFGSECGDICALRHLSDITGSDDYRALSEAISSADPTLGAAAVRDHALARLGHCIDASSRNETPNDTLAIEYIRNTSIPCVAVKRIDTASASDIRKMDRGCASGFVPLPTISMMEREKASDPSVLRRILWTNLRLCRTELDSVAECGGGLGDRLLRIAREATDAEVFFSAAATKRYTNTRILRAALFALLGVTESDLRSEVTYTTLLAASARGRAHLASLRKGGTFPIITKPADAKRTLGESAMRAPELGRIADELYTLTLTPAEDASYFLRRSPYMG